MMSASANAMSRIEIRISCNKLQNKDFMSKSDPCCIMSAIKGGSWTKGTKLLYARTQLGRTETIQNNLNPSFEHPFEMNYFPGERQIVRFDVYDIDNDRPDRLADDDHLGQLETTLSEIVSQSPYTKPLVSQYGGKPCGGTITLRVTELKGDAAKAGPVDVIQLRFRAQKLDKKDIIGKSDPFLEFCRRTTDGKWETVLRSEVVKNNQNPTWPMLKIKAHQLSGGDYSNPIKVFCKDWDAVGEPDLIGCFMTSVSELIRNSKGIEWPCINEAKKSKKNYTNSGVIILVSCEVVKE